MPSRKRARVDAAKETEEDLPQREKRKKWQNKHRALVFCARGVTFRARHLMKDVQTLLPHSRTDTKLDRKEKLPIINEVCEMKNCSHCIFFEMRKKKDLYMWISNVPNGPSAKFLVENVHTMDELKLTGNCLVGSRPLLSFDPEFSGAPHLQLLKELLIQVFSTPHYHPKSKPFIDHTLHFGFLDNRIWFRNYQIVEEGSSLSEIGPRFVLNLIKIFDKSFGGATLYQNPNYITPNTHRQAARTEAAYKYKKRVQANVMREERRATEASAESPDPLEDLFQTH